MATKINRQDLVKPEGLFAALQALFPDFGDDEFRRVTMSEEPSLHTVMREFSGTFRAASAERSQLVGLARLVQVCVAETDILENAVGTCFLEHLRQIDKQAVLRSYLASEVKAYIRPQ